MSKTPSVESLIVLSDLLGEMGAVERKILLPNGRFESDSHHSFSLALIAYDICAKACPELDREKILRYALVHDMLEIITGDVSTLTLSHDELVQKHLQEQQAMAELSRRLADYPSLLHSLEEYERLDTPEAAAVFVLDKTCTIWAHFHDKGATLHVVGAKTRADIERWHSVTVRKFASRLRCQPPKAIMGIFEQSYQKMREELFES